MTDEHAAADLWRRAIAGDADAFESLIAPVLPAAYRLAATMLKDRDSAEDAVQEAALKAWQKLDRFRPDSPIRPWFLAITANQCRTSLRSRWAKILPLRAVDEAVPGLPEDDWASHLDLARALDQLPKRHLLALTLYYSLDLPVPEVAAVLGCSVGAAKVRIHRAVRALRPAMQLEAMR